MRHILVDRARKHQAAKRGAGRRADKSISKVADPSGGGDIDVLALGLSPATIRRDVVSAWFFLGRKLRGADGREHVAGRQGVARRSGGSSGI
jgi:hypothetical protein